ncbi:hypothetical protein K1719_047475 [Acacia pycnantha]|nr:hypothetical protein K1719_047475 [Acacia pycnantha]
MIGRADIEGSKSNVAMNAWLPQASYPCVGFPLSVPVLSRLFDARGRDPEGPVPSPSPGRHAATRSRRGSSSSSPPTADGFGAGTPVPSPQSQSFSRGYGSILPTSLAYIVPSTRGCSPWRPDAVMSTTGRGRHTVLRIFKGRRGRTGHHATCGALPAAGPYLRLSRFQGGQAVKQKRELFPRPPPTSPDSLTLPSAATSRFRNFNPIPFRISLRASTRVSSGFARSGIVHHLSGPDRYALTRTLHRRSRSVGGATHEGIPPVSFLAPYGFTRPLTRTHVRLLGPCFKTGRMGSSQADAGSAQVPRHAVTARAASHDRGDDVSAGISTARAWAAAAIRVGPRPESIGGPALTVPHPTGAHRQPHPLPSRQFQALFDSLFKVLFIFPSRYLFAIGLSPVFSLGRNLPPDWGCIPKQPDSPTAPRGATGSGHDGALTLSGAPFQGTWARSAAEDASPDYNSDAGGDRFSWWAVPGSLAVTRGILVSFFSSAY